MAIRSGGYRLTEPCRGRHAWTRHRSRYFAQSCEADVMGAEDLAITEARRLLGNCVLFSGLSTEERAAIVARARMRTFNAGETVFTIGSPGDQMLAVLSGT